MKCWAIPASKITDRCDDHYLCQTATQLLQTPSTHRHPPPQRSCSRACERVRVWECQLSVSRSAVQRSVRTGVPQQVVNCMYRSSGVWSESWIDGFRFMVAVQRSQHGSLVRVFDGSLAGFFSFLLHFGPVLGISVCLLDLTGSGLWLC